MGASSHSLQAASGHNQLLSDQLNGLMNDVRRHAATDQWCLLSLVAGAVALP
jgi:hypothetical protein